MINLAIMGYELIDDLKVSLTGKGNVITGIINHSTMYSELRLKHRLSSPFCIIYTVQAMQVIH